MPGLYLAASGAYCANHPGASNCSPDNVGAEVIAILIVAAIVALAIFGLWWRYGNKESDGPVTRFVLAMTRRFGPRDRR
jgi:uncharacterized membrane protein YhhN